MKRFSLLLAVPTLAACATPEVPNLSLAGSKWTFVAIDGAKPVGKQASLNFEEQRLGANVGCNGMGGSWRLVGGRLTVDGIVSTMMFCEGIMAQEQAVAKLLEGRPSLTFQGNRLFLHSDDHSAELVKVKAK